MAELQNKGAEQYVIGAMLSNPTCIDIVAGIVSPEQFTDSTYRDLFYLIQHCSAKGMAVDVVTLSTVRPVLSNGDSTIACAAEVHAQSGGSSNVEACAQIIAEKSKLRLCLATVKNLETRIKTEDTDSESLIAQAQSELTNLSGTGGQSVVDFVHKGMKDVLSGLQERMENGGKFSGLLTGIQDIDNLFEGMRGGMMIVIAGRPASGKTTLAMNIAENVGLNKVPSLVFSLEMTRIELSTRMIASMGKVPLSRLNSGKLEENMDGLTIAVNRIKELPVVVCDRGGMTIEQIRAVARFQHRLNKIELIVIDYISLIKTKQLKGSTRTLELGEISRQCKEMAKELNIPVIVLAQLNRDIEKGGDREPRLSDLRDSGEIEQDADIVAFVQKANEDGTTRLVVAKNRHAKTGACTLLNRLDVSRFESMPNGYTPQQQQSGMKNYV